MSSLPKLVRDGIPDIIIKNDNRIPVTRVLEDPEYKRELFKKLIEEAQEVIGAENPEDRKEELADVLELIKAIAELDGASLEDIENIRAKKAEERGGFEKRIFLEEIKEA